MNQHAVHNAAGKSVAYKKRHTAACRVVNSRCRKGDREMKQEAHPRASFPALECRLAERSTRNRLKQSFAVAALQSEKRRRADQVKNAADGPGKKNDATACHSHPLIRNTLFDLENGLANSCSWLK